MGITRVGALTNLTAASSATAGDFVFSLAGLTIAQGDVLLLWVNGSSTAARTLTAAGDNGNTWTIEGASLYANDTRDCNAALFISKQGTTLDTSITVSGNGSSNFGAAHVLQYRGVDGTTQVDVAAVTATGINGNLADPAAITPVTAGAKIVAFYAGTNAVGAFTAWTAPGNLSNWAEGSNNSAVDATMKVGSGDTDWSGSGAFDPAAVTGGGSTTSDSWAAATIALRPAASTVTHSATGTLTGQLGSVAGAAVHKAKHTTSGALTGSLGSVSGTAKRFRSHASSGAITGQLGSVTGTAKRFRAHAGIGSLAGQTGTVSGLSARLRAFAAAGDIVGAGTTVDGSATHAAGAHDCSGELNGDGASISGHAILAPLPTRRIRKTPGGWSAHPKSDPSWSPNDNARGSDWTPESRKQSTWTPNDQSRGTQWNTKAKGPATW